MNMFRNSILAASTVLVLGTSYAEVSVDIPANLRPAESTLTRAEVVADLLMWRAAGLEPLTIVEGGPDTNSYEYRLADTRYRYLRSSPQYDALVDRIKREGAPVRLVVNTK